MPSSLLIDRIASHQIDACVECPAAYGSSSMEQATKWDANHLHLRRGTRGLQLDDIFFASPSTSPSLLLLMEAELEKARGHARELEEERRVMTKRLERFLRKLADEKAAWKARVRDKARHAVAALRDELGAERRHRRQLEQANARLLRDLAEARSAAKQQAQSYEMERKARELMEDACSELTREVEEDQAEVELLRRECLRMREEMEEERRMLQMAEVWREERVQMKLSDAKLALENKYTHLNRLQAEMEAFLRSKDDESASHSAALREARLISDAAAATSSSVARSRHHPVELDDSVVDADSVLDHFRRKERERHHAHAAAAGTERGDDGRSRYSSSPASPASSKSNDMLQSVSPATDLFLAKADDDDDDDMYAGSSADLEMDSCSWVGTSDRSASVANGNGVGVGVTTEARSSGASRRSTKNTALIRRLWRSAITESRKKTGRTAADGGGWSPSPSYSADRRRSSVTAETPPPPPPPAVAGEQCSSSGASGLPLPPQRQRRGGGKQKQSLKEKLLEARMDDQMPLHAHAAVKQKP